MFEFLRRIYDIEGIIQGVGFRPTLYCYSVDSGLGGWIRNCSGKVELAIEGSKIELDEYVGNIHENLPAQARIDKLILVKEEKIVEKTEFRILESEKDSGAKVSIPADLAMCKDCEQEILNPKDRRFGYAFTTCINCGPRYTVVNSMPYDRCRTTLDEFPLCPECEKEYTDPRNRRFHAESTACPVCGPKLWIADGNGDTLDIANPIKYTAEQLEAGKIAAIRGIGGYLLAVNAFDELAVKRLRERKKRPHKPFAVMARSIDVAEKYCLLTDDERCLLTSSVAPIVILDVKKTDMPMNLLSPDSDTLGVMIPYTPLHKLLFEKSDFELLVMTSGNRGGEPICIKNEEAFERLTGIVDFFLCHNREINLRNDDSLCIKQEGEMQVWRRARGFAPDAVKLNFSSDKNILAMGAELKNSICVLSDDEALISPHIGDLESPEAVDGLQQVVDCFPEFLYRKPELVVVDKHPDMHSTRIGRKTAKELNIPVVEVQHHFAHAASCMAENNLSETLALVFDGTGLGDDGNIWGGELLYCNLEEKKKCETGFVRLATFSPVALPGGDSAVYHPVKQIVARLIDAGIETDSEFFNCYNISESEYKIWKMQIEKSINSPLTHAVGRLFDAFSSLLKISPDRITYEGQGAIRLEAFAQRAEKNNREYDFLEFGTHLDNELLYIDCNGIFKELYKKKVWLYSTEEKEKLALGFHYAVAGAAVDMVKFAAEQVNCKKVCCSGGVFMNRLLTTIIKKRLSDLGVNVYLHKKVPPNDGGISLGQSVIASRF